jgi:hypothetical protein
MPHSTLQHAELRQPCSTDSALQGARTVLVIDASEGLGFISPAPGRQAVILTRKSLLSAEMIASVMPDAVIGPLITRDWDIVDLGIALESMGYRGDLYALTEPLPRAELVIREVGALCRSLTVRLLETVPS